MRVDGCYPDASAPRAGIPDYPGFGAKVRRSCWGGPERQVGSSPQRWGIWKISIKGEHWRKHVESALQAGAGWPVRCRNRRRRFRRYLHAASPARDEPFRCVSSRPEAASAAPGIGTATPAHAATLRACSIPTSSSRSCSRSGFGLSAMRPSRRSFAMPTTSQTASTYTATSVRHAGAFGDL
jgi:hypothetical protein